MNQALEFLYQALAAEYGLVIESDNPERLKQQLYAAKQKDEAFRGLSILVSPFNPAELWIVKNGKE